MSAKVTFVSDENPNGTTVVAEPGELLTQCAFRAGVIIQQTCGGTPSCADCKIKVVAGAEGAFAPPEGPETRLIGNVYFITHERLACQAKVLSDCTIFVPKAERRREKVLRKNPRQDKPLSSTKGETNLKRGIDHGQQKEKQKNQRQSQESHRHQEKNRKGKKG